jgi:SAM-dependent methyltransferase
MKNMPKIEAFEKHTARYEAWFEIHQFAYQSELLAVRKLLPVDGRGLEIGVGSGKFAEPLGITLGIEPSPKMSRLAQQRKISVVQGVAEMLPFHDAQFDYAVMITAICFLDDINASMNEACRILKPAGTFIIGFVDRESSLGLTYQRHQHENVFYKDANFFSVDEIVSFLIKAGFVEFNFKQTIFHSLNNITDVESVKDGYGEGAFVVIKALKR